MKIPFLKKKYYEEFDAFARIRLFILLTVFGLLLVLLIFLYKDFYQTIVQANQVIVLKQEVALQNIDLKKFNQIFSLHIYKQKNMLPENIPDPFMTESAIDIIQNNNIDSGKL